MLPSGLDDRVELALIDLRLGAVAQGVGQAQRIVLETQRVLSGAHCLGYVRRHCEQWMTLLVRGPVALLAPCPAGAALCP